METTIKKCMIQIDNDVYNRMLLISHKNKLGEGNYLTDDEKISQVIEQLSNVHYKNYMIDNLLF